MAIGDTMNRNEIINVYNKSEFLKFLEADNNGKILELLNAEGLSILEKSQFKENRIAYILTYSKYKNELFQNSDFLDLFFKTDLNYYYASLGDLQPKTYESIIDKYLKLKPDPGDFAKFFSYFNKDYKLKKIDNWPYDIDVLYEMINKDESEIIDRILEKNNIDMSDKRINIENLILTAKESVLKAQKYRNNTNKIIPEISIPVHMINKGLAKRLLEAYDIFKIRKIINDLQWCTNPEEVNNYIKNKEDNIINNYREFTLNSPYQEIFELLQKMKEASLKKEDNYYTFKSEYTRLINNCNIKYIDTKIEEKYKKNNMYEVYNYLKELSDREISNYIIDYNFEENYHNIMIDIREEYII